MVLTSVDRDDVSDFGADHIAKTCEHIKAGTNPPLVEVLTPDFNGNHQSIERVVNSGYFRIFICLFLLY